MEDNFIEKLMQPGDQSIGQSGPDGGACASDNPEDTRFIRPPVGVEEDQWARICAGCRVFSDCISWADEHQASGVYVAGEWRE